MIQKEAQEQLSNKALDILHVKNIFESFLGDSVIEGLVAMNLSLRTSVHEREKEYSETICELLEKLSDSSDMSVRWAVAKNPHTSIQVLEKLSKDDVNLVRALIATNPKTPTTILQKLFSDEKIVRDGLSGNPSTPLKYLEVLSDDTDTMVRLRVIENSSCTKAICEKLLSDKEPNIRQGARAKLERLNHAINSDPLHVEKHLLSLSYCGSYINTQDIVEIGNALGIELPYKKRSLIMQTLLLHAKEHNQSLTLLSLLCEMLEHKNQALLNLLHNYPKSGPILQNFIFKTNTTKLLLQRELALHVKENDDA